MKTKILTQLRAVITENEQRFLDLKLEPIQCIDIDYGQIQNPEKFELYTLPAIFIKTQIERESRRNFKALVQVLFAANTPSYTTEDEIVAAADIPIYHYRYQKLIRELIESLSDLGLEFISDEELDIEAVHFVTTQFYEMHYEELRDEGLEDYELEAKATKILIGKVNLVKTVDENVK